MQYRVILLLVVGLMAFSSAMKELNEVRQLALDATSFVAQLAGNVAPNPVPQIPEIPQTAITVEAARTCEIKQSLPSVELPWLEHDPRPRAVVPRPSQVIDLAKLQKPVIRVKKLPQIDIDPVAFEFTIPSDPDAEPVFKMRTRRHDPFRINPRDREFLKTLNRSINLRTAS
jgi:hypothetical protein